MVYRLSLGNEKKMPQDIFERVGSCRTNPSADKQYYGRLIGTLKDYAHNIRGTVYATDENTLFIKSFSYDGMGPDAYFWVGKTMRPSPEGIIVPYPEGNYVM
ncbi:hypothetical protein WDU94_012783 [Cyamophila willieti]